MNKRINLNVINDLKKFGVNDWNHCFHCGNCTASCPLTEQGFLFPRKSIRSIQMGLKDNIASNLDPWLCYYCGDCSQDCPQEANPGELMMSLRRYLTSLYDWTGLSRLFYTKKSWEFISITVIAAIVVALFAIWGPPLDTTLTAAGGVKINSFAPINWIHLGDLIMAAGVALFLITNIFNMWYKVIIKPKVKISLFSYIREAWQLPMHFATQAKFSKCDANGKKYWASHWLLMSGYTIMFIMIVALLPKFQVEEIYDWWHWQRLLGYYATFGLLFGLVVMFIGRIKKSSEKFKFSHLSDWLFVIMLFLTTLSGILLHFFRIWGMPYATYYSYIIHLAILVPMICVEVPFSKWSHLAYRPFAIYFANLKKSAQSIERKPKLAKAA